jgi:hypothetical protein
MTTVADKTAENKNFGGDNVDALIGGDDIDDVNTDGADESKNTGINADDKNTIGSYGEAEKGDIII